MNFSLGGFIALEEGLHFLWLMDSVGQWKVLPFAVGIFSFGTSVPTKTEVQEETNSHMSYSGID